ncbi:hypothetical protein XCR1_1540013 [Xenorhabdus cabanillasii JM26]|uniref:Uncharacterized protein n=1 Tax=Xenorhabdus cabanillasii JM26 TaxID=1427517 RepID=W1IRL7_9GAMM|nr:hypothetical protein XCR1_1540013 [Xenorhabdus cabanillasii JM26]
MSSFASDTDNFPDSFNEIYKHLLLPAGLENQLFSIEKFNKIFTN